MKCLTLNALNQDAELIAGIKAPQITSSQALNWKDPEQKINVTLAVSGPKNHLRNRQIDTVETIMGQPGIIVIVENISESTLNVLKNLSEPEFNGEDSFNSKNSALIYTHFDERYPNPTQFGRFVINGDPHFEKLQGVHHLVTRNSDNSEFGTTIQDSLIIMERDTSVSFAFDYGLSKKAPAPINLSWNGKTIEMTQFCYTGLRQPQYKVQKYQTL